MTLLSVIRHSRGIENDSYKRIRRFLREEVEPIIKYLYDETPLEISKESMRKYLIVMLISSIEHFFRSEVKFLVDRNDLDIKSLFGGNISFSLEDLNRMQKEGSITNGNIVASNFNFGNLTEINQVFSHLLGLDFLDYLRKLNDVDQTRYILDGHPILFDYGKLMAAYQLRNEIVHQFKETGLSNWKILSLWDNAMNIMDISVTVFQSASDANLRSILDSNYQWGIERESRRRMYELYSPRIVEYLKKNIESELAEDGKPNIQFLDDIKVKDGDEILIEYIGQILRKMQRKKLIVVKDDALRLTTAGEKKGEKRRTSSKKILGDT